MQNEFEKQLYRLIYFQLENKNIDKIIFLCIGTDRITGDCLGPLVGSNLKELFINNPNIEIIGNIENPLHLRNINNIIKRIRGNKEKNLIISIDSALAQKNNIGEIYIQESPLLIGKGLNKNSNIKIGNISIKGVVGKNYNSKKYNFMALQNVPLGRVIKMVDRITLGIYNAINV